MYPCSILLSGNVLTPLGQKFAFNQLGYSAIPASEHILNPDECFKLWTTILIDRMEELRHESKHLLVTELLPDLTGVGAQLAAGTCEQTPILVVGDSRYATWSGRTGYLDLEIGDSLQQPNRDILESFAYNLGVLFARCKARCQKIQEQANADTRRAANETP